MELNQIQLKVKVKSLAVEAKIIRKEEEKLKARGESYKLNNLVEHRKGIVRRAARHTLLVYGYLRGRTYAQMEPKPKTKPDWVYAQKMLNRFSFKAEIREGFGIWAGLTDQQCVLVKKAA